VQYLPIRTTILIAIVTIAKICGIVALTWKQVKLRDKFLVSISKMTLKTDKRSQLLEIQEKPKTITNKPN